MSSLVRNRELELNCSVCLELFDEPRILPCGHTFCAECLMQISQLKDNGTIRCPECSDLSRSRVNMLLVNYALKSLVDNKKEIDQKKKKPTGKNSHKVYQVFVVDLQGKVTVLDGLMGTDFVSRIKLMLFCKLGIHPREQRLIYMGKNLEDSNSLKFYNIVYGEHPPTINLVVRLKGGVVYGKLKPDRPGN